MQGRSRSRESNSIEKEHIPSDRNRLIFDSDRVTPGACSTCCVPRGRVSRRATIVLRLSGCIFATGQVTSMSWTARLDSPCSGCGFCCLDVEKSWQAAQLFQGGRADVSVGFVSRLTLWWTVEGAGDLCHDYRSQGMIMKREIRRVEGDSAM